MTPNEARHVIESTRDADLARRDVIGKAARADMRAACLVLACESLRRVNLVNVRQRPRARRAAILNTAAAWRRLAVKYSNKWSM